MHRQCIGGGHMHPQISVLTARCRPGASAQQQQGQWHKVVPPYCEHLNVIYGVTEDI